MRKHIHRYILAGIVLLLFVGATLPVSAASTPMTTDSIAQSYSTDAAIRQGMIVGQDSHDSTKVVPLTTHTIADMLGVVISASDAPLTLTGTANTTQVYVATNGRYNVLVSDQNGPIRSGDYISISGLNGIGMKAQENEQMVLGRAVSNFSGDAGSATGSATVTTGSTKTTVHIGLITVAINVTNNPNLGKGTGDLPGFLKVASSSIANKPVTAPRVYLSLGVLVLTAFISGSLLYSGVRNGIVSIGRNPLARRSIVRSLLQVVLVSVIVFIIGLFAVYLLLRL
jgi:hypothetical protein